LAEGMNRAEILVIIAIVVTVSAAIGVWPFPLSVSCQGAPGVYSP
jgi:hypothetical protein